MKKYELFGEPNIAGLRRIKALIDLPNIEAGDIGGWVESGNNLSHVGNAWVSDDAWVYGKARVFDDARVYGNARVSDDAWVYGDARVYGNAKVYGNARVLTSPPTATRSDNYTFCIFLVADGTLRITAGCRLFKPEEAVAHWTNTRGGTQLGYESLQIVDHLVKMMELRK